MNDEKKSVWKSVKERMDVQPVDFGRHITYCLYNSPRRMMNSMSYYKFAAKMIGSSKRVLDIGCGEGLGTWLLAVECGQAQGVDFDEEAIQAARNNWRDKRIAFQCEDILKREAKEWDAVVCFDVIEHILPQHAGNFLRCIGNNVVDDGIAIIGTSSAASEEYASDISKVGYVNVYSCERLEEEVSNFFNHVFVFAANDELIHTGYLPLAQYLVVVACGKRSRL